MYCPFQENRQDFSVHHSVRVKDAAPNFVGVGSAFEEIVAEEAKPLEH